MHACKQRCHGDGAPMLCRCNSAQDGWVIIERFAAELQMLGANPSFPPVDVWQKMSESDQDALIQAIENSRKRRQLAIALACVIVFAVVVIIGYHAQLTSR